MKILINHVGYERTGSKRAVVMGKEGDLAKSFRLIDCSNEAVRHEGPVQPVGPVSHWRDWHFWLCEFSSFEETGKFRLECNTGAGTVSSHEFLIEDNLLGRQSLSDALWYFKTQRATGIYRHYDQHLPFAGPRAGCHDVRGGWADASGDYGKHLSHLSHSTYFNPQQGSFTAWVLFKVYEILEATTNSHYYQVKRRLLDEAIYGADYMYAMRAPSGSFFRSVGRSGVHKRAEDSRIGYSLKGSSSQFGPAKTAGQETVSDESYETAFRQGAGLAIAALAAASRYSYPGLHSREEYLAAAKASYEHLETHNTNYTNDGQNNLLDTYCQLTAATELYRATQDPYYRDKAAAVADELMQALVSTGPDTGYWQVNGEGRPFFHAAEAGFPTVALLNYLAIEKDRERRTVILQKAKAALTFELTITKEVNNPFGLARQLVQRQDGSRKNAFFFPHDTEAAPWWQGENARLASLATAARLLAAELPEQDPFRKELEAHSDNQLNWILGLNPFDSCMQQGTGRNNPAYHFLNGFDYLNCPGGICNGITSGLENEEDIEFYAASLPGVVDDNWRWAEQWLPHASWYIYAVALGAR